MRVVNRGRIATIATLLKFYILPAALNDQVTNLSRGFAFAYQLVNKETLLETKLSTNAVSRRITIQQTLMPITGIAITVTGLLRENFRILLRVAVGFYDYGVGKLFGVKHRRQRSGAFHTFKKSGNSGRRPSSSLIGRLMISLVIGMRSWRRRRATGG